VEALLQLYLVATTIVAGQSVLRILKRHSPKTMQTRYHRIRGPMVVADPRGLVVEVQAED
jgi:hypothetical protein